MRQGERVVLGLTTCPQCDVLKAFLEERKLPYRFVKWDKADPESRGRPLYNRHKLGKQRWLTQPSSAF